MASLEHYATFLAIIEAGNQTLAARRLGRSLQAVSRALAELESELGVTLVRRTTRRSEPSEAGLRFYKRVKAALADLDQARAELAEDAGIVAGQLRIAGSSLFGPLYLVPAIAAFMERHPGLRVSLTLSDAYVDPVRDGVDLAIRIGEMPDSALMARRLGALRRVAFAAPLYLGRRSRPASPADLRDHDCVIRTAGRDAHRWSFRPPDGGQELVEVRGSFETDSAAAANEAVARGLGIGMAPLWQIRDLVDQGRVELVLAEFEPPPVPIHAVWPPAKTVPARTRLFIDFLAARLAAERI